MWKYYRNDNLYNYKFIGLLDKNFFFWYFSMIFVRFYFNFREKVAAFGLYVPFYR